jgi:transposase
MREHGIYDKPNLRKTVEGILYRMRTGLPWRDLPPFFGVWISIYQQFNRWSSKNKLMAIFKSLVQDPDLEWEFIDGSIVKAHQHSTGAASADAHGLPIDFIITGGEVHDCKVAPQFVMQLPSADYTIADKGYDKEELREIIRQKSSQPVIPRKSNSTIGNDDMDWGLYKYRHLVENIFARIKHFRAIATRYDKLKRNYASMVALACGLMWLPM